MAKNCVKCGRKLSAFGKTETKDGYICRQCAKQYKTILGKDIDYAQKTIEELDSCVADNQKSVKKILIIIAAGIVVAIAAMGLIGHFTGDEKSEEQAQTTVQEETKATATEQTETVATEATESTADKQKDPPIELLDGYGVLPSFFAQITGDEEFYEIMGKARDCGLHVYDYDGGAGFYDMQISTSQSSGITYGSEYYEFNDDYIWVVFEKGDSGTPETFWDVEYVMNDGPYRIEGPDKYSIMQGIMGGRAEGTDSYDDAKEAFDVMYSLD